MALWENMIRSRLVPFCIDLPITTNVIGRVAALDAWPVFSETSRIQAGIAGQFRSQ